MFPEVATLFHIDLEKQFELINKGMEEAHNNSDSARHLYYLLDGGEHISAEKVNKALHTIQKVIRKGKCIEYLSDDDVIKFGDKVDAIMAYRRKYPSTTVEAKQAIEFLRGEDPII